MTKKELQKRRLELQAKLRELQDKMGEISLGAQKRELTEEENTNYDKLEREFNSTHRELSILLADEQARSLEAPDPKKSDDQLLRELCVECRDHGVQTRTVTMAENIENSGAIALNIHQLIPTMNEGLGLPSTLHIVTGVTGNDLYPVGVNDTEMEEAGENVALTEQELDFDKITVTNKRAGMTVAVSNTAIDNADFDLMGYVKGKFDLGLRKYLAAKIYSQAAFTGIKGPFSGLAATGTIDMTSEVPGKDIDLAIAAFGDKGFNTQNVVLVMDCHTEAILKNTPIYKGEGAGFVIQNGKCKGYEYVVTHYINTKLDADGKKLVSTTDRSIGVCFFDWLAVQQHGQVRLTVDSTSAEVAKSNKTVIVMNTAWSITDLSVKINKKGGTDTQAFARYTIKETA